MALIGVQLRDDILGRCVKALVADGFEKYKKYGVDFSINDDWYCWVGLNTGVYSEKVRLNPFVGVHARSIMKLYAKVSGRKYNREVATYSIHLGEIAPTLNVFDFFVGRDDFDAEASRLARSYIVHGLPYAKSIARYDVILPLLESRIDMLGGYPERVACCLYLMGRMDDARSFTEQFLAAQQDYFADFAVPFLRMLDEPNS